VKLTIISEDNTVYVDGVSHLLDLTTCEIPATVHALQWNQTAGWIEFKDKLDGTKANNEVLEELPVWALDCVAVFEAYVPPAPEPEPTPV